MGERCSDLSTLAALRKRSSKGRGERVSFLCTSTSTAPREMAAMAPREAPSIIIREDCAWECVGVAESRPSKFRSNPRVMTEGELPSSTSPLLISISPLARGISISSRAPKMAVSASRRCSSGLGVVVEVAGGTPGVRGPNCRQVQGVRTSPTSPGSMPGVHPTSQAAQYSFFSKHCMPGSAQHCVCRQSSLRVVEHMVKPASSISCSMSSPPPPDSGDAGASRKVVVVIIGIPGVRRPNGAQDHGVCWPSRSLGSTPRVQPSWQAAQY
mmetsp:Transcript_139876/g.446319  ORF Transcript_139876/g.446319 Transcript_139876/m.446319 type:complete len:269 (+) Transcript_139876:312-1118(+)